MKKRIVTLLLALCLMLSALLPITASADEALLNQLLDEVSGLSGMEAYEFFNTLADR